ncbi:MAG: hypothetical protein ACI9S8_002305 [Chlamydiales bacterium]|jgi:hypothetical protein
MKEESPSLKHVLDDLLEMFPFTELKDLVKEMVDPLNCKDTQEVIDALQKNMELLRTKETHAMGDRNVDANEVYGFVENPSNFSKEQWGAIEKTKQAIRDYEREVDIALESGQIQQVVVDGKKAMRSRRRQRMKRFTKRKKWIPM